MNSRSDSRIFTIPNVLSFLRLIDVPFFLLPTLRRNGAVSLPVHFVGKIATFCLLIALPLVLLGAGGWVLSSAAKIFGWAFAWWGAFMYWWAGLIYVKQTVGLARGVSHD